MNERRPLLSPIQGTDGSDPSSSSTLSDYGVRSKSNRTASTITLGSFSVGFPKSNSLFDRVYDSEFSSAVDDIESAAEVNSCGLTTANDSGEDTASKT